MSGQVHMEKPVGHIVRELAVPASTGLLFNTLYNVVDTYFAGRQVGTAALSGITIAFPIYFIVTAVSGGLGSGTTALCSIALGKDDRTKFHHFAVGSLLLSLAAGVLLACMVPLLRFLMLLAGAEGQSLVEGLKYIDVIFFGAVFFCLNAVMNGFLNSQGDSRSYRNFLILGFFLNVLLDPLFVMGWGGLPRLGAVGVALSTVLIQASGSIYLAFRCIHSKNFDRLLFLKARASLRELGELLRQGVPAMLNIGTTALGIFVINYFILKLAPGSQTIAAYGAAMRVEQLALIPTMGLNTAALAICGQSFGAGRMDRIHKVVQHTLVWGVSMISIGGIIIYPLVSFLLGLFSSDKAVIAAGVQYLHIELFAFPTYVILGILVSALQGIKKPDFAVYIGLYRQICMPWFLFTILGRYMGISGVYVGIVVVNWSAVLIACLYYRSVISHLAGLQKS